MKLPLLPSCFGEAIIWVEACRENLVVDIGGIFHYRKGSETSGQCMAEWSIMVLAMDMMVWMAFSATPLW